VTQTLSEFLTEVDTPGADGLAGHLDTSLEEEFFDITVTEGVTVVEPNGMTDDGERESVARQLLGGQHPFTLLQQLVTTVFTVDENFCTLLEPSCTTAISGSLERPSNFTPFPLPYKGGRHL